jgi:hypothetical protein
MTTTDMLWADVPADVVKAAAAICDGHGIFDPAALTEVGVPQPLVDRFTETFESDFSNPKSTIFDNKTGLPINQMRGVYGYNVLSGIVRDLKIQAEPKFGRGFQAEVWKKAIVDHFDGPVPAEA